MTGKHESFYEKVSFSISKKHEHPLNSKKGLRGLSRSFDKAPRQEITPDCEEDFGRNLRL